MTAVKISLSRSEKDDMNPSHHVYFNNGEGEFQNLKTVMMNRTWSPIRFIDGYRTKVNFISSSLMSLDFDSGQWSLKDAVAFGQDYQLSFIIGLTKSHQKDKKTKTGVTHPACDRFRMVIQMLTEVQSLRDYEHTMTNMMHIVPCDKSCKDGARFFYPCTEIYHEEFGPCALPWLTAPERDLEAERKEIEWHRQTGTYPEWIDKAVQNSKLGTRHNSAYAIAAELSKIGYKEPDIVAFIMKGPIKAIGVDDVRRAVRNGIEKIQSEGYWSR